MSRVAIWMTNYANEKHLAKAIDSVLNQSFQDFTLFIFDNHSPGEAPEIIDRYATINPGKIVNMSPLVPKGLAGIPLMDFAWHYLNKLDYDYSMTLGGHDLWPNERHLELLVNRADNERKMGSEFSLIYTDTWQINEEDQLCGRFQNFWQQGGQTPRPLLPQWLISSVDSPQLFGLWNESIRKHVPIRHLCAGWDHLVVMHAGLLGPVLYEPNTSLVMRAPPPGDGLHKYAQRHFSKEAQAGGHQDFLNQLEWLEHCVGTACEGHSGFTGIAMTAAMFTTYLVLRGYNLAIFEGGPEAFNADPKVQRALKAVVELGKSVRDLTHPAR